MTILNLYQPRLATTTLRDGDDMYDNDNVQSCTTTTQAVSTTFVWRRQHDDSNSDVVGLPPTVVEVRSQHNRNHDNDDRDDLGFCIFQLRLAPTTR